MTRIPGGRPTRRTIASRLGPFRRSPFAVYWIGGFVSNIGTWLQAVAASVFVYSLTGSAFDVGVLNFASFLPIFLFSIVGGIIGDRFDRRTVVVVTHSASGLLAALLAVIAFAGAADELRVIVIAFGLNASYAIAKPALSSILPAIVPRDELTEAVGVNTLQFVTGQMIGPVLAAIVIAVAGVPWAFALNAVSYLGPIVAMLYLGRRGLAVGRPGDDRGRVDAGSRAARAADRPPASTGRTPDTSVADYVRQHRWVLALLLGIVACSAPLEVLRTLSPALAAGLGQPESAAGYVVAAQSAGSSLALLAFIPLQRSGRSRDVARAGLLVQATGLLGAFLSGQLWLMLISVGLVGFGFSLCFPVLTGGLQAEVPDAVRGRVMAFHQTAHLGNRPFAALAAGSVAALAGAQPAVLIGLALTPLGLLATRRAWRGMAADRGGARDPVLASAAPVVAGVAGARAPVDDA